MAANFHEYCATMLPVALVSLLRLPLRAIPDRVHAEALTRLFNHLLRGQSIAARLPSLDGKSLRLDIADVPSHIDFAIRDGRLCPAENRPPDVTIRGRLEDFWQLATRAEDPDTLFFQRRLGIEGDTETGLHVKNLLDALDYDLEAHIHAVLGNRLARPLVGLLRRLPHPGRRRFNPGG
jgi:predicted lipid carrier protein YhbT